VTRWSFDNDERHVTAFRPISEAAHSWSYDKLKWQSLPDRSRVPKCPVDRHRCSSVRWGHADTRTARWRGGTGDVDHSDRFVYTRRHSNRAGTAGHMTRRASRRRRCTPRPRGRTWRHSDIDSDDDSRRRTFPPHTLYTQRVYLLIHNPHKYGEMTSQNLWSRYDRHFVGIIWHNVWT